MSYKLTVNGTTFDIVDMLASSANDLDPAFVGLKGSNTSNTMEQVQTTNSFFTKNNVSVIDTALLNVRPPTSDSMPTTRTSTGTYNIALPGWCNVVTGIIRGGGGGGGARGNSSCVVYNGGRGGSANDSVALTFNRTVNTADRANGNVTLVVGIRGTGATATGGDGTAGGDTTFTIGTTVFRSKGSPGGNGGGPCSNSNGNGNNGSGPATAANTPTTSNFPLSTSNQTVSTFGQGGLGAAQGGTSNEDGDNGTAGFGRVWFSC